MWARARCAAAPSRAVSASETTPEMPSRSMAMNSFTGASLWRRHGRSATAAPRSPTRRASAATRRAVASRSSTHATSNGECM